MGLLGKVLKISIPTGFLYLTCRERLWAPGAGSPEAEKRLASQRKVVTEYKNRIHTLIGPYVDPIIKDIPKLPEVNINPREVKQLWNCGVKMSIGSVANFEPKKAIDKIAKLFEDKPKAVEASK